MNGSKASVSALGLLVFAAGLGCSDGKVSIGDNDAGTPIRQGFVGDWDGYVQVFKFIDGSSRVRMSISADGTGTIRFGNTELWTKATDPNAKYPPSYPPVVQNGVIPPAIWDGFAYTLRGLKFDAERLEATVAGDEIFSDWCALQTSHQYYDPVYHVDVYSCDVCDRRTSTSTPTDYCEVLGPDYCAKLHVQEGGGMAARPDPPMFDLCERGDLCRDGIVCQCDANGCHLRPDIRDDALVDAILEPGQTRITGTLWNYQTNYNVVLKRR